MSDELDVAALVLVVIAAIVIAAWAWRAKRRERLARMYRDRAVR